MTLELAECRGERLGDVMSVMRDAFVSDYGEAWTEAQCSGILIMPGVWMTLATRDGAPAGFTIARIVADEAELLLIGVVPHCRRTGIGGALVQRFTRIAGTRGARRVFLEMRDGNDAGAMYRAHGFEQVGRRPNYYRGSAGQSFDALTLSHELS